MNTCDIKPGVKVENVHNVTPNGHHYIIESVEGVADDSIVTLGLHGPNGVAHLRRRLALVRDHYRACL